MSIFGDTSLLSEKSVAQSNVESALLIEEGRRSQLVVTGRQYNDIFFLFLFVFHLVVVAAVAIVFGVIALSNEGSDVIIIKESGVEVIDHSNEGLTRKIIGGIFLSLACSATLSSAWIYFLSQFAAVAVSAMLTTAVLIIFATSLAMIYAGLTITGIVFLLLCVVILSVSVFLKPRLDFAAANLSVACEAILQLPWTIVYSIVGQLMQISFIVIWSVAIIGYATNYYKTTKTYHGVTYNLDSCTSYTYYDSIDVGSVTLTCSTAHESCKACLCGGEVISYKACFSSEFYPSHYVLLLISLFWTCSTLSNVVHCTTSAAVAAWWANNDASSGAGATHSAFVRSLTSSLGSICCGSLLVAIVRTLRTALSLWASYLRAPSLSASRFTASGMNALSGVHLAPVPETKLNAVTQYVLTLVEFLLKLLDRAVVYFNRYAFCYVAMYGLGFVKSSRAAAALFMSKGWTTLFNDDIVDLVLHMGHVMVGVVSTLVSYLYARNVGVGRTYQTVLVLLGFLGGYLSSLLTLSVISSAVSTIYICYAENPTIFETFHPQLFHQLETAWQRMFDSSSSGGHTLSTSLLGSMSASLRGSMQSSAHTAAAGACGTTGQRDKLTKPWGPASGTAAKYGDIESSGMSLGHAEDLEVEMGGPHDGGGSRLAPAPATVWSAAKAADRRWDRGSKAATGETVAAKVAPAPCSTGSDQTAGTSGTDSGKDCNTVRGSFGRAAPTSSSDPTAPLAALPGWGSGGAVETENVNGYSDGLRQGLVQHSDSRGNLIDIAPLVSGLTKALSTAGTMVAAGASAGLQAAQAARNAGNRGSDHEGFDAGNSRIGVSSSANTTGGSFAGMGSRGGSRDNLRVNIPSDSSARQNYGWGSAGSAGQLPAEGSSSTDVDAPPSPVRGGWGPARSAQQQRQSSPDDMNNSVAF